MFLRNVPVLIQSKSNKFILFINVGMQTLSRGCSSFHIMPPKKRAPKAKTETTPEILDVPSNPKTAKKEKQVAEVAPTTSKRIVIKRGSQLKSADFLSEEDLTQEPVTKKKRGKVADKEKSEPEAKDAEKKTKKKVEAAEVKKKTAEVPKKKEPKTKEVKEKKPAKTTKKEAPTTSEGSDNKNNKITTDWKAIKFDCVRTNQDGNLPNFKITSWNVDGIRAWVKKDGLKILEYDSPDILCLQETKCSEDKLPEEFSAIKGYHKFWCASDKNGYAGVGLLTKEEPIKVTYGIGNEEQDVDGRCLTAEYEKFHLINVYVPNSGRKLVTLDKRLEWNELFKEFIKELDKKKPVILCGDLNVAHNEIDLSNPKTNKKNAGFTDEEREGMTDFLQEGFIDSFRCLYPDQKDVYTFWTYLSNARKRNVGWRLDYFLLSKNLQKKICDCVVLDKVYGSDHCPITLFIRI